MYCREISFQIPDGYFLNFDPEMVGDNGVRLYSPDQSYTVELRLEEDCDGSARELTAIIQDLQPTVVYSLAPLTVNNVSGHHTTYRGLRHQHYEAWFDVDGTTALSLVVETQGDILKIDTAALVAAVDPRLETE